MGSTYHVRLVARALKARNGQRVGAWLGPEGQGQGNLPGVPNPEYSTPTTFTPPHSEDSSSNSKRGGLNLIGNGSFRNGKDIVGHAGSSIGNKVIVYPNPSNGEYQVEITSAQSEDGVMMKVYDVTGRLDVQKAIDIVSGRNTEAIHITSHADATYFIQLEGELINQTLRVIKQ